MSTKDILTPAEGFRVRVTAGCVAVALVLLAGCAPAASAVFHRPNLLFVATDQQSYDMLGCYGSAQIITPNLDRLASEGLRFSHCISSSPLCTPWRAMLHTGQHPLYNGAFTNDIQLLVNNGASFGEVLRDHGYRMGYIGKWHLYGGDRNRPVPRGPHRHGFDGPFLTNNCTVDFRPGHCFYWDETGKKVFFNEWEPYAQTRQALEFLDQCSAEQPFALFVQWHPPHDQGFANLRYETLPELMELYKPDKIQLRPNVRDTPQIRKDYQGYMAMCSGIDRAFGSLMDKLRAKGLDENTIVVFTSDHGDMLRSNDRPRPKGVPEVESIRVPLLVRWPARLRQGQVRELLVGTLDLMPSLLGLMKMPIPASCQGRNLSEPILSGRDDATKSIPLFYYGPAEEDDQTWYGVYTRRYTYAYAIDSGAASSDRNVLYDHVADPWQQTNFFETTAQRAVRKKLHALTEQWMRRFNDFGVEGRNLVRMCFGDENQRLHAPGTDRALPGRPIDLLKSGVREARQ